MSSTKHIIVMPQCLFFAHSRNIILVQLKKLFENLSVPTFAKLDYSLHLYEHVFLALSYSEMSTLTNLA